MRVLLSTYGSRGDVEPIVGLARQLRECDVEVRVCAPPDEEFARLLTDLDVSLLPFGKTWRSWQRPSSAPERSRRVAEFIAAQYGTLVAAAQDCDLLVATAMSHFVAGSVAEKLAIAHRYVLFAPNVITDGDAQNWNPLFGPPINTHRALIGLPPVEDVREFMFTDQPWLAADPTLAPSDLDVVRTGAWIRPDDRPLPAELVAFLAAGTPPVYVGFGSMSGVSADIARVAIEAIRARGQRALLAHGWADLALIDDRDDCFAVGEVNQQALFGQVAAVVHHGGAGTTTTAARAGAPQVVIPQAGDQPYWAGRMAELGIGAAHDGPTPTTESLTAALGTALSPRTQARATAVAKAIRTDGAQVAAQLVLDVVRHEPRLPASIRS
jgi:vancomycin aglycone glucosyltransferase